MAKENGLEGKLLIVSWTLFPWPTGSSVIVNNVAAAATPGEVVMFGEGNPDLSYDGWREDYPTIYRTFPRKYSVKRGKRLLRWLELGKVSKEIQEVIRKESVDRILCIFPNEFYLCAAFLASQREGISFYTWFHNTYFDNVKGYRKLLARWLQPKVFRASRKIFVMSDGMKSYMDGRYPGFNFQVLRHGFPLPEKVDIRPVDVAKPAHTFVFTGSLNSSCEDATIRLMQVILANPNYELHIYSGNPKHDFAKHGVEGERVIFHDFTPLEELYKALPQYDIMLLPHGFDGDRTDAEFKTIFPTRTIPLLVSGRPILAHSPSGVFFTDFLKKNDCALVVDEKNTSKINSAIKTLLEDKNLSRQIIRNAINTARMFDIDTIRRQIQEEIL